MKKLSLIILCFITFSCEEVESEPKYSAIGTYKLESGGLIERIYSGDNNQYRQDKVTNLYNECSRNSTITINANGTFQKEDFIKNEENCATRNLSGTWAFKDIVYGNVLGEFQVNNSNRVYKIYSTGTTKTGNLVTKIEVTYGSILDDPSARYIYTYIRIDGFYNW